MANERVDLLELFEVNALLSRYDESVTMTFDPRVMFVAGRAEEDDDELLDAAARWAGCVSFRHVVIPGHDGSYKKGERVATGYPGFEQWKNKLLNRSLSPDHIISCIVRRNHEKITHTREETDGFVLRAMGRDWDAAFMLAHSHQLPRLMGCFLKSAEELKLHHDFKAVPLFVRSDWNRPVYGSLGEKQLPRWQHVKEELRRINDYLEMNRMVPLATLRDYLLELGV